MSNNKLTLAEKLSAIQTKLKAPKNLYNSFGKYSYRNAEGIQEALKPLLADYCVYVTLSDEVLEVGGRVYVKATATIATASGGGESFAPEQISVTAYAREADVKKGMDDAQITGSTSSYARKYALNGLFLLDDNKDNDSDEYQQERTAKAEPEPTPEPTAPAAFICEDCGNPITARGKASAEKIAASSRVKFGRQLCYDCGHAEKLRREALPFEIDEGGV